MTPSQIVQNGILNVIIRNYEPRLSGRTKTPLLVYGQLRRVVQSRDLTTVRLDSELDRQLFRFSKLMPGALHSAIHFRAAVDKSRSRIVPVAIFLNGIFVTNDDARRFYGWLKLNSL